MLRHALAILGLALTLLSSASSRAQDWLPSSDTVSVFVVEDSQRESGVALRNLSQLPISVSYWLSGDTNFTLQATSPITIPVSHDTVVGSAYIPILVRNRGMDTSHATLLLKGGTDSFLVQLVGVPFPKYITPPSIMYPGTFTGAEGDTSCATVRIKNTNEYAMTMDSIRLQGLAQGDWSYSTEVTFPITLQPGDSTHATFCFHGHNARPVSVDSALFYFGGKGLKSWYRYALKGRVPTEQCLYIYGDSAFGPIGANDSTAHYLSVINPSSEIIGVDSVQYTGDVENFAFLTSIAPRDYSSGYTLPLPVRFYTTTGTLKPEYSLTMKFFMRHNFSTCEPYVYTIHGYANYTTSTGDTQAVDLYSPKTQHVSVNGDGPTVDKYVDLINSGNSTLVISSISLADGTHFSYEFVPSSIELPDTLAPTDKLRLKITLQASDTSTYSDDLIVVTTNGLTAIHISLDGKRSLSTAAVQSAVRQSVVMHVSPNPSRGAASLTVSGARSVRAEVLDLLGRKVERLEGALLRTSSTLPAGNYVIRAEGVSETGEAFVISRRLVIQK